MDKYNTLPRRLVSRMLDASVLLGIYWLCFSILSISESDMRYVISIVYFSYYLFSLNKYAQTPGMFIMGTKIVDVKDRGTPNLFQVFIRELFGVFIVLVSVLVLKKYAQGENDIIRLFFYTQSSWFILQFFVVIMSRTHRTIHDFIAQTVIVKVMPFGMVKK